MGGCISSEPSDVPASSSSSKYESKRDSERNRLLSDQRQSYGTETVTPTSGPPTGLGRTPAISTKSSAKPIGQFMYLDRKYSVTTPKCGIPDVDQVFDSVCERYDIAVVNREKIDEALLLFKQVLEMDRDSPLVECFAAWKEYLVNPRFTVNCMEASGDVKDIRVRADDIPKERRKAQKHIRDLLDACHLFLQQREFLERNIVDDLTKLDGFSRDLQSLAEGANLNSSQKKNLNKVFSSGQTMVGTFPQTIELFWRQTYSLMHEINTSVHVLDGVPGPESADLH